MNQTVKPELKSPEMKEAYIVQFLHQDVFLENGRTTFPMKILGVDTELGVHVLDKGINLRAYYLASEGSVLLTPLDQITDENALRISYLSGDLPPTSKKGRDIVNLALKGDMWLLTAEMIDYLRLNGYAVDWNGHSVQELIEAGYMKLREGGSNA